MSEEAVKPAESAEESTPTITIAEKQNAPTEPLESPTITIAEKEGEASEVTSPANETGESASEEHEEVHYQAVEKEGTVTAIWEMQGQKHIRTIDPRSHEGKQILALFETAG